jgi:transcriptional regulator with GAF, ATPase, and Fis domain
MIEERRPQAIFDRLLDTVIEFTRAERGFFLLAGEAMDESQVVAARNFDHEAVKDALSKVSRTLARRTLETGDPVLVTDAAEDEGLKAQESVAGLRLRSVLTVPVRGPKGPIGLLYLDNRFERGVFEEGQLPLLRMFADQAAIALRNAQLHEENARRLEELTQAKAEVDELNRILSERVARTSAELQEVKGHVLRDQQDGPLKYSYSNIVGRSRRMRELFHLLDKVTDSDVPVLIQGESGTGKELVARALHFNGPRGSRPFVSENCAAIPETLLESELFGYKKGAFTGAHADKKGLFEVANGGTLFLDEVGDMDLSMQKKLLRVLQEGEIRPVGGERTVHVDVRILTASNQDLRRLCSEGRFREDLYFRLAVITVDLPPLRERREDIPLLVDRFLDEFAAANKSPRRGISEDAMEALLRYDWPGNVRELRNEVHRAAALSDKVIVPLVLGTPVRRKSDEPEVIAGLGEKSLKDMVRDLTVDLERRVIREALRRTEGRKSAAARLLGVSRPTLDAKIETYGIDLKR